jgi:hypothetical protein
MGMNASDRTDANTIAELEENSYMEDAATYADDKELCDNLLFETLFDFADKDPYRSGLENALLDIFQSYIQYEKAPDWIEPLIDKCCKERFGR